MAKPVHVTEQIFDTQVLKASELCWWTSGRSGARPCRISRRSLRIWRKEYEGKVKVAKVGRRHNKRLAIPLLSSTSTLATFTCPLLCARSSTIGAIIRTARTHSARSPPAQAPALSGPAFKIFVLSHALALPYILTS